MYKWFSRIALLLIGSLALAIFIVALLPNVSILVRGQPARPAAIPALPAASAAPAPVDAAALNKSAANLESQAQTLRDQMRDLESTLGAYKVQIDALQRLVGFGAGLAALYAIVLGFGSYVNAQQQAERAREKLEDIDDKQRDVEASAREKLKAMDDKQRDLDVSVRERLSGIL